MNFDIILTLAIHCIILINTFYTKVSYCLLLIRKLSFFFKKKKTTLWGNIKFVHMHFVHVTNIINKSSNAPKQIYLNIEYLLSTVSSYHMMLWSRKIKPSSAMTIVYVGKNGYSGYFFFVSVLVLRSGSVRPTSLSISESIRMCGTPWSYTICHLYQTAGYF